MAPWHWAGDSRRQSFKAIEKFQISRFARTYDKKCVFHKAVFTCSADGRQWDCLFNITEDKKLYIMYCTACFITYVIVSFGGSGLSSEVKQWPILLTNGFLASYNKFQRPPENSSNRDTFCLQRITFIPGINNQTASEVWGWIIYPLPV